MKQYSSIGRSTRAAALSSRSGHGVLAGRRSGPNAGRVRDVSGDDRALRGSVRDRYVVVRDPPPQGARASTRICARRAAGCTPRRSRCASRPTGRGKNHGFRQAGSWRLGKWPMRFANAWLDFPCSIVTSSSCGRLRICRPQRSVSCRGCTINHVGVMFTVHASDYARV
jgi:hypothetical protein